MDQSDALHGTAEVLFERAAAGFIRAAEGGRYDAYCAGQLRALEELGLVAAERVEAVLRPGAHRLCGCWF